MLQIKCEGYQYYLQWGDGGRILGKDALSIINGINPSTHHSKATRAIYELDDNWLKEDAFIWLTLQEAEKALKIAEQAIK